MLLPLYLIHDTTNTRICQAGASSRVWRGAEALSCCASGRVGSHAECGHERAGFGRVFIDKSFFGRVSAAVKAHQILLSLLLHVVDTVYVDVIFVQFEERHRVAPISFGWQFSTLRIRDRKWYRLIFSSRW